MKKETYQTISQGRIIGAIGTGLALSLSTIGILFKFQSYPGSFVMLIIGLLGMTIATVISFIKSRNSTDNFYSNILKRFAIYAAMVIFLLVLPTKIWMNWKYPNNPEYVQAVLDAKENPDNPALWGKVENEREKMWNEKSK